MEKKDIDIFYEGVRSYKKVHEPAEEECPHNHDQEEREAISDLSLFVAAADQSQDGANKGRIYDHGKKMTLEDHGFFPKAMSKASRATK